MFTFPFTRTRRGPGGARLRVVGSARAAEVAEGETLLRAAVRAQIPFPHLCNVGECGACKCRLTRGQIRLARDISRHVSPEELCSGFILACQSLPESEEVEVELPGVGRARAADAGPVQTDGTITGVTPLAPGVVALEVALAGGLHYVAGQYAQLTVPSVPELGEPRCYSFAEAPGRASPRRALFHVRHVPGGAFTDWLFAADRQGARLGVSGPHGSFRYRASERPLLCVAGGTGLAPIKAILEQGLADGLDHEVTLVVGARTRAELYAQEAIAALETRWRGRFTFVPVLSREPEGSGFFGRRAHVTDVLRKGITTFAGCAAYLCGPPGMIDAALELLRGVIPPEHLHHDRFLDRGSAALAAARVA